ncbi:acetate--CoA ligase family protein [Pedococcus sp. P5_B7]
MSSDQDTSYTLGQLDRFFRPRTIAIVGASERQPRSNNAVESMKGSDLELYFVNPTRDTLYGDIAYPNLAAIDQKIDAVLSLVPASAATQVAAEAHEADAGGIVVVASGFGEVPGEGPRLQRQLASAAASMPLLGPNCNGFVRPVSRARLTGAPLLPCPAGNIGVVTHSGALLPSFGVAAQARGLGFSSIISTGNEMSLDVADCLQFYTTDDETQCVLLALEAIRRPKAFFAALDAIISAGKPVIALKLGRSVRGSQLASSHTGALAGEAAVYAAALQQHGVVLAEDIPDLLDRVSILSQVPSSRWSAVTGIAGVSLSGGWATLASDLASDESLEIPMIEDVRPELEAVLGPRSVLNPMDLTGFAQGNGDVIGAVVGTMASAAAVDALVIHAFLTDPGETISRPFAEAAIATAAARDIPVILSSVEDADPGSWVLGLLGTDVALGRGLRQTLRGLSSMRDFANARSHLLNQGSHASDVTIAAPDEADVIVSQATRMLTFDATMRLLAEAGVPVAPYVVLLPAAAVPPTLPFPGPYVVKLADVPHRTDIGAVRIGVQTSDLAAVVNELRTLGSGLDLPTSVAVQPLVKIGGEAFVGVEGRTDLGPFVAVGIGGIFVEALSKFAGRLAPLRQHDAEQILEQLADIGVFEGLRGQQAWDREKLETLLVSVGRLASGSVDWLESLDINPLVVTENGYIAVDGLCIVAPDGQS